MQRKKKPNIIFISFDDCRADHLEFMGYKKDTSPFLDSLAKQSAYFTRAFATGSGSPQSFVGTMTSTYPMDYGGFSFIDKPRVLVSEVLQKAGYKTVAVHSAAYLSAYFGYDRGWDIFRYLSHFKGGGVMAGIRKETWRAGILKKISEIKLWLKTHAAFLASFFAAVEKLFFFVRKIVREAFHYTPPFFTGGEVNKEVVELLPSQPDKPLFLWVHYMDIHELGFFWRNGQGIIHKLKFHLADTVLFLFGVNSPVSKVFKNLFIELYDATIRSVDGYIGELVRYLQSKSILSDDDVLVLFSDHGEEFFEKGEFGHGQRPFNANLNIPLIVWSPNKVRPQVVERPVSLIDVSPTILNFAGVKKPAVYRGRSLFDDAKRAVASQQVDCEGDLTNLKFLGATVISDGYKFIDFRGEKLLFSVEDKDENENLYNAERKIADELERILKKHVS